MQFDLDHNSPNAFHYDFEYNIVSTVSISHTHWMGTLGVDPFVTFF